MRIQNNIAAYNTHRNYTLANNSVASSAEKLSSGYKINRAGDDAAGLAISEKMRAQIRGLEMASKNSSDAVSLVNTAEGALQKTHDILQRMRELATQSASDGNEQVIDRGALNQEFQQLKLEIDDIARVTRFNDQNLIDGTFQKSFYSTNITDSALTRGTIADVSRVQVKTAKNIPSNYEIDVQYIAGTAQIDATAADVKTNGANGIMTITGSGNTQNLDPNSAIAKATFTAVAGAEHNGKTFTISATADSSVASTNQLVDGSGNSNMVITITDGDTVYTGTITSDSAMNDSGKITIDFDGVGRLTLDLGANIENNKTDTLYNVTSALNTKDIKFQLDGAAKFAEDTLVAASGGGTALKTAAFSGFDSEKYAGATIAYTTAVTFDPATTGQTNAPPSLATGAFTITLADGSTETYGVVDGSLSVASSLTSTTATGALAAFTFNLGDAGSITVSYVGGLPGTGAANVITALGTAATDTAVLAVKTNPTGTANLENLEDKYAGSNIKVLGTVPDPAATTAGAVTGSVFTATNDILIYNNETQMYDSLFTLNGATGGLTYSTIKMNDPNAVYSTTGAATVDITIKDIGTFTLDLVAGTAHAAQIGTWINSLNGAVIDGASKGGTDTVAATQAKIALELNGEVVTLAQNDKQSAFDSTGIKLDFNALDFAKISDDKSALAQFTTATNTNGKIKIGIVQADGKALTIQTGANQGDEIKINIDAMNLNMLGLTDSNVSTQKSASRAITEVNNAINQVSTQRAALGALSNRLNFKIENLDISAENLTSAESRIRDVDMAKEMTAFSKKNILSQAATAMLAQANSLPQNVLQLLR